MSLKFSLTIIIMKVYIFPLKDFKQLIILRSECQSLHVCYKTGFNIIGQMIIM